MTTVTVRAATPADIPTITAIYRPAVLDGTASFEIDAPDAAEMRRRYDTIVTAGYPYIVAELDDRIAGYAYANAYRPRPAYRYSVEDSIYIAPWAQRHGVGRALLTALIEATTAMGCRQMIAVIGDSDQPGSIGLHTAFGFTHCGVIRAVGFKHGRWLDSVIMQRALGDGSDSKPV